MPSSASVNLIKNRENPYEQVLHWALSVGRLLIIITEVVAFSTFIYRFSLDRTIIDLHSKIKQETVIVESLKDREDLYRNLQERIAVAKQVNEKGSLQVQTLSDIIALTPQGITFNSFDLEPTTLTIDANLQSVSSLNSFTKSLKSYSRVSSVSIDSIDNKPEGSGTSVVLTVKFKQ